MPGRESDLGNPAGRVVGPKVCIGVGAINHGAIEIVLPRCQDQSGTNLGKVGELDLGNPAGRDEGPKLFLLFLLLLFLLLW